MEVSTRVEGAGRTGRRGAALASTSCFLVAVTQSMRAQLLGLPLAVLGAVVTR